jgi:hypothetical protein
MIITTSQYRNAHRLCRSSIGHGATRSDAQRGPERISLLSINAPPFTHDDPLCHCIGADQFVRSTCRNSHTASAAPKSP